ncbi:hypothetical protein BCR43DRAFT_456792 [Syncephalastrum racemosum]|uniref:Uncharacterized protein n=1 Tax=Syncephalastrum racemosum TaxID=13706 RepID=A0A1X2HFI5_SYNRA|nr:hypothetical protein BCR43DRAFT_456792 [Syncephalastrum racemosum]
MRFSLLATCALALLSFARADELQDEVDAAKQKFCSGIKITGPTQGQQFADPTQIQVTVERTPDAQAKVVNGVDIYSIAQGGSPKYIGTPWKGNYNLQTKATLTVDITKTNGVQLPSQFEFRVWVHNESGPDCTLMSQVFQAQSSQHTNAADEAMQNMDTNIDRGCFAVDVVKPELGEKVDPAKSVVQIKRDPAAHVEQYKKLDLYKVNLDSRQPEFVQTSWQGTEAAHEMFNVKAELKQKVTDSNVAYFYKLSGTTQHQESCEFYSHPFYFESGSSNNSTGAASPSGDAQSSGAQSSDSDAQSSA